MTIALASKIFPSSQAEAQPWLEPQTSTNSAYHSQVAHQNLYDHVFALRYQCYYLDDYIDANPDERFMDEHDHLPNTRSFLTYYEQAILGSIRACTYYPNSGYQLPVMDIYANEIAEHVGYQNILVEANRFVVHPEFQKKRGARARLSIYYNIVNLAIEQKATSILIAVRPNHVDFYKMFYLVPISSTKRYHLVRFDTVLMACYNLEAARDFIKRKLFH